MTERKLDLLSLWWLRVVVVGLCAAAGVLAGAGTGIWVGALIWGALLGLLLGLVCGVLGARLGLPYPGKVVGAVLAGVYLLLVALSVVPGFLTAPLSGMSGIMLTLPWSALMVTVVDTVEPSILDSVTAAVALLSLCAMVNAAVIYGLGMLLSLLGRIPRR